MVGARVRAVAPWLLLVAVLAGLGGCERSTSSRSPAQRVIAPRAAESPAAAEPPAAAARRALFHRLVQDIRAYHVFSDAWPEERWERELPRLEQEVRVAADRSALFIALHRVSASLRDGHLSFVPADGWMDRGVAVLPVTFFRSGPAEAPRFTVQRAAAATGLAVGDELVRYDGLEPAALLDHFAPEIDRASPGARAARLTELLYSRNTETHPGILGSAVAVRVRRGDELVDAAPVFAPNAPPPESTGAAPVCAAPQRDYGSGYELAHAGSQLCLYRGVAPATRRYPIVRHVSFLYPGPQGIDAAAIRRDHELVRRFLATTPALAGVLLDLRDNGGGHHSDLFLPWYLPGRYARAQRWVRLHPALTDRERLTRALWSSTAAEEYVRLAATGQRWWVAPFECSVAECPPLADALVTRAPVAVLVGPRCRSSCDTFVSVWTEHRAGPTVGEPPAAMLTSNRYPIDVRLGDESLGTLTIALSGYRSSESDPWREGRPPPVDVPVAPSWPAAGHEREVIDAAIRALARAPSR